MKGVDLHGQLGAGLSSLLQRLLVQMLVMNTCLATHLFLHGAIDGNDKYGIPLEKLLEIESKIQTLLPEIKLGVVSIVTEEGAGSGVLVSPDGLILTAAHVITDTGRKMEVILPDGRAVKAISLGGSEISDAGMLRITEPGPWQFVKIAESNDSQPGDWCLALGHPSGYDPQRGIVLRAGRILEKKMGAIQSECRLLGGDSGGPLFNLGGEVIAIHSRITHLPDENFHIPIESFRSNWDYFLSKDILTLDDVRRGGFLGVTCDESFLGLVVKEVVPSSAAESIGLLPGDTLLRINGVPLDTCEKLTILISEKQPGEVVELEFVRSEREIGVKVRLGERSSN